MKALYSLLGFAFGGKPISFENTRNSFLPSVQLLPLTRARNGYIEEFVKKNRQSDALVLAASGLFGARAPAPTNRKLQLEAVFSPVGE